MPTKNIQLHFSKIRENKNETETMETGREEDAVMAEDVQHDTTSSIPAQELYGAAARFVPRLAFAFNLQRNYCLIYNDETQKIDCHFEPDDDEAEDDVSDGYNISHDEAADITGGARENTIDIRKHSFPQNERFKNLKDEHTCLGNSKVLVIYETCNILENINEFYPTCNSSGIELKDEAKHKDLHFFVLSTCA